MTELQNRYWQLQESKRANQAQEKIKELEAQARARKDNIEAEKAEYMRKDWYDERTRANMKNISEMFGNFAKVWKLL